MCHPNYFKVTETRLSLQSNHTTAREGIFPVEEIGKLSLSTVQLATARVTRKLENKTLFVPAKVSKFDSIQVLEFKICLITISKWDIWFLASLYSHKANTFTRIFLGFHNNISNSYTLGALWHFMTLVWQWAVEISESYNATCVKCFIVLQLLATSEAKA